MMEPYTEERHDDDAVILRFAEYVDQIRRPADDQRAFALVDQHETVVCDLSLSVEVVSRWLKLLSLMSDRARAAGKRVVLVGVNDSLRRTSDWLGLAECFEHAATVSEALQP